MSVSPAGSDGRIAGVDVARGLAVLGMFGAHVGVTRPWEWGDPSTWLDVVNGRSSILFAVLAGVSIAIMTGRDQPVTGADLRAARIRILVRAAAVFVLGAFLELLGTDVAVILPYYALLFVAAVPVLRLRPPILFGLAGLVAVVAPVLVLLLDEAVLPAGAGPTGAGRYLLELLATGYYPVLTWTAFVFAGLGVGRLALRSTAVQLWLIGAGAALAAIGYGLVPLLEPLAGISTVTDPATGAVTGGGVDAGAGPLAALITSAPHSGSPFEVIGSGGFAIAMLGLCLLATGPLRVPLFPVGAVGSMALTVYTLQILAIAVAAQVGAADDNALWLWFTVAALVACTVWVRTLGRGPLERLLTRLSSQAARP